ncbi:MAG: chemotaxis protein CheD [Cyclobacteriaceae bacterium]|nr:chemotaxis protein CheD [Cyclobacteriaceae bacterium]
MSDSVYLNIGELYATNKSMVLTCYGLGSCVGLFLYDRLNKISGGAHIMLSGQKKDNLSATHFAQGAIEELLRRMKSLGSDLAMLRAKIIGGAEVMDIKTIHIGKNNIEEVRNSLIRNKIYIAASDVGGTISRTGKFYTDSGNLLVSTSEYKEYYL